MHSAILGMDSIKRNNAETNLLQVIVEFIY
jgi:hypothetical protein